MGEIFSIISGKGGVGKTFFAINLACSLAKLKKRVLLIDANITTPNISIILKIDRRGYTLHDLLKSNKNLEEIIINNVYSFDFIPGSLYIEDLIDLDLNKFYDILKVKEKYDYILLDSSAGLGRETYSSLKISDYSIIITNPEKAALMDALRAIKICRILNVKIAGIIVNRYKNNMNLSKVETFLGERILGVIHEDSNVEYSINVGIPLIEIFPDSIASKDIISIAKKISKIPEKDDKKRIGFFDKILKIFKWK